MLENLYHLKMLLDQQGLFFCFSGPLSQTLLVEIGDILKNRMKSDEANSSTILKVFSVFIEQAQNILHYSSEKVFFSPDQHTRLSHGIVAVGYNQEHYYVVCGNLVKNESVDKLRGLLMVLQNMSKEELKEYYKEQRKKSAPQDSKGAHLGLIELARKAIKPIEFYFHPIDHQNTFFSLKTEV